MHALFMLWERGCGNVIAWNGKSAWSYVVLSMFVRFTFKLQVMVLATSCVDCIDTYEMSSSSLEDCKTLATFQALRFLCDCCWISNVTL